MGIFVQEKIYSTKQLFTSLGIPLRGHWRPRKPRLMGHLHQCGTECLVVDNAHDLSLEHLMFLKELTDQGHLQYDHQFGVCQVEASRGSTIPLKEIFDQPETTWQQFFRRLDQLEPYCRREGHTSEEVREILAALERVYHEALPQLNLLRWGSSIYTWLTQSVLDPTNSGRVTMNYLMKLVKTALEWSYEAKATDVKIEMLEKAASLLVLRRNTLWIIDGAGPSVEAEQARVAKPVQMSETQAEQAPLARSWTLSPSGGVLRFKSHDKRKMNTPNTGRQWARGERETDWEVVGGERT